ncbi:Phosphoribosylformylglycinamidine synthase [uncultured Eubacteriales bacterium]|uniref:Phosphoribosylformylglycinamidine synthase n=1 Tax=uncultured Eubacteriales bacterium TaxID=172733 RepID=A0A212KFK5_9FIRM|nr:Phosphoribosylformylglycinamidine synthase [uncultured Eubacteriales bacterium]
MVYRVYVEKRPELAQEAAALLGDLRALLRIEALRGLRLVNRYDVEGVGEELFRAAVANILSEPQLDTVSAALTGAEGRTVFAVEYLPGQFDQRADSAAQCIQLLSQGDRPAVRSARVYVLEGDLTAEELMRVKKYLINPVDSREAALGTYDTLAVQYERPTTVETLTGFLTLDAAGLAAFAAEKGLAMDLDDLKFCQAYFRAEEREPTITEVRVIDTYWSDHCRHTTFLTEIDAVRFEDAALEETYSAYLAARAELGTKKPITLMDLATVAARVLRARGQLPNLDESEEINACTVKINIDVDGEEEPWLLLFKNETHNHPTEIEPFGGAATCIGGAIRDPLSGRAYVYAAMRVTGAADPTAAVADTLPGKLPQRRLVTTAAAGYSAYGNQIGLATGQVDELYHPGYVAKRMEIGAVLAAAPARNVRREVPLPGDVVILLGGRTGRDGCGGATGSSKSHSTASLETCGAEVQKGNAPEERKLQRLFRSAEATTLIKRCNDFGAGGVSVAIGELADGLEVDLDAVPRKYEGLDGTELAISESQERMAVVVAREDAERFCALARGENLEATLVAVVTAAPRLRMCWNGARIVDLSREFLNSNGAPKHAHASQAAAQPFARETAGMFSERYRALAADLNVCSKRGLAERFDSTVGAGTVLMPFGGRHQRTPPQAMVQKISVERGDTSACSYMAWGYNPFLAERSPFHSAYLAVVESVSKLVATGASFDEVYLTFQEYFEKPGRDPARWGKPLAALLGAFRAQMDLGVAAIGGKDSMSGSFEGLDVPPTLVSFAVTTGQMEEVRSPEFKAPGHPVVLLEPEYGGDGLPTAASLRRNFALVHALFAKGRAVSAWTPTFGGAAEGVLKMTLGNGVGFRYAEGLPNGLLFGYRYGAFLLELTEDAEVGMRLGETVTEPVITRGDTALPLEELSTLYEGRLESVFPCNLKPEGKAIPVFTSRRKSVLKAPERFAKPRVLIPVFPGTNCEYDTAKAILEAGGVPEFFVVKNLTAEEVAASVRNFAARVEKAQAIVIPGGFSGGDEPDGSGKFITAFFRGGPVRDAVTDLLDERGGLMLGICNGFQALIKLGLVPYGRIVETDAASPTLTYNAIGHHQSKIVRTRVASNRSPWLLEVEPGEVFTVPISHGEGRFLAEEGVVRQLAAEEQIATQYVDLGGLPTDDVAFNPNHSVFAVEGITSPDGRVLGKMGHSERIGRGLYRNVPGRYDMGLFRSAVRYFK